MEAANLRLRVVFDDRDVLTKSQKKEGLKHSWVLLKPHLHTISDVVSYLLDCFDLHDSCPNGVILSMDSFVLPPFESTAILKDKDLIRVKKRGAKLHATMKAIEEVKTLTEDEVTGKQLSTIKENGDEQRETDGKHMARKNMLPELKYISCGDEISRKRKSSSGVEGSKKKTKKQKCITPESAQKNHVNNSEQMRTPKKKRKHENESKDDAMCHPAICVKGTEVSEATTNSEGSVEPEEIREENAPVPAVLDEIKKLSRSTRRRKAKRKWEREQCAKSKTEQAEEQRHIKDPKTDSGSKMELNANTMEQQVDEIGDAEDNLVPVLIRPGHIRFTPSTEVKDVQGGQEANDKDARATESNVWEGHSSKKTVWGSRNNQVAKEAFQWNGITNKRKGQKWGMEKQPTSSWKGSRDYDASSRPTHYNISSHEGILQEPVQSNFNANKKNGLKWGDEEQPTGSGVDNVPSSAKNLSDNSAVDFEKLAPLTDLPKASDVLAYRLVELSSSWCPELSSFRVGRVLWVQPESNKVMLVPDPEYPLDLVKKTDDDDEESEQPPGLSVYNEDESLEIDFTSLVDVRVVKHQHGDPSQSDVNETPQTNGIAVPSVTSECANEAEDGNKNIELGSSNGENASGSVSVKKDAWEEITDALCAKKVELMQEEDGWCKKEGASRKPWSRRGSALGPIMERLRSQNAI